jgi:hypothetical protein
LTLCIVRGRQIAAAGMQRLFGDGYPMHRWL